MEKSYTRKAVKAGVMGALAAVGYMYLKNNPNVLCEMKTMAKDMAKKTYDKLEEMN